MAVRPRLLPVLPLLCLFISACASATAVDGRLTTAGRAAAALMGQSPSQQVDDMTDCRERVMDGLFYAGAYVLHNPLQFFSREAAMRSWHARFAQCLHDRGYSVPGPPAPTSPGQ